MGIMEKIELQALHCATALGSEVMGLHLWPQGLIFGECPLPLGVTLHLKTSALTRRFFFSKLKTSKDGTENQRFPL
jgi:hypothetical protein